MMVTKIVANRSLYLTEGQGGDFRMIGALIKVLIKSISYVQTCSSTSGI